MNFCFVLLGDVVQLQARLEDGDLLGDAYTEVRKGEEFFGVSYDALRKAGNGVVEVDGDTGKIVADEEA